MDFLSKLDQVKKELKKSRSFWSGFGFSDVRKIYKRNLKRIPDISHLKNIIFFSGVASILILFLFAQRFSSLHSYLPTRPVAGGTYEEGMVGEIKQLNPLFTPVNFAEDSAASLIFSGLVKNVENRQVEGDLAESWQISEDKKIYTFELKDNLFWHDGERLDADDVYFTFSTIQNPDANSPRLATWKDVNIQVLDEKTIKFTLPNPYASFIYLADVPILPEHILRDIPVGNLRISEFSTNPIGSGPYVFDELKTVRDTQEVHLFVNEDYFDGSPYIEKIVLKSYPDYGSLISAYDRKEVFGVAKVRPYYLEKEDRLPNIRVNNLIVPEYDILYYNLNEEHTKNKVLREAISLAINKEKIIEEVYYGEAVAINSAILPGYTGYNSDLKQPHDLDLALEKLKKSDYTINDQGELLDDGDPISLRLASVSESPKKKQAELIAEMIRELGIKVEVKTYPIVTYIEEVIRPRNFDLLLITQNLGPDSDIYTFYHTNMAKDPGLNLSGLKNRQVDKYLEIARTTHDKKAREAHYKDISELINSEVAATYICWPSYLYGVSRNVKREHSVRISNPKDRFWDIKNWYIREERDY